MKIIFYQSIIFIPYGFHVIIMSKYLVILTFNVIISTLYLIIDFLISLFRLFVIIMIHQSMIFFPVWRL